ncbi:unnamed protein product [Cylicostephanus goldi]|uniref:Uncharacterized protein n=1 Tax=Cylicostephanus goldi TaxID=71465 RepID=A0A3P6QQ71_CYLGO|nr:unnamed protein product [Cylicostephanus goldi]
MLSANPFAPEIANRTLIFHYRSVIRILFKYTFYLGVLAFLASTVAILLNCADGAKTIKGSKPLCADLTKLSEFKRPSPLFLTNARNTYGTVVHGYWGRVQPSIHALQKKWNEYYREFVKSDIGIAFDRYYHKVHGFIVDSSLKTVRFLEAKRREIEKWWEKDGRARFGSFVDTLKVTAGVVYEIAKDIVQIAIDNAVNQLCMA